ncbi:MAG: hypothetical protein ACREJ5_04350 [Geminicoccaceae bacterium]
MTSAVRRSKRQHQHEDQTGELRRSIRILRPAQRVGPNTVMGAWGTTGGQEQAALFERGSRRFEPPRRFRFLRPAADAAYRGLVTRLRTELAQLAPQLRLSFRGRRRRR